MHQVVEQTYEQKMQIYLKMPKHKLAEMLIECNRIISGTTSITYVDELGKVVPSKTSVITTTSTK